MSKPLEIQEMISTDLTHRYHITEIRQFRPKSRDDIYFALELHIGYAEETASDLFQVVVASPEGLRTHESDLPPCMSGRGYLIVMQYDWEVIERTLHHLVWECSSDVWLDAVAKLCRHFFWEYDDHNP